MCVYFIARLTTGCLRPGLDPQPGTLRVLGPLLGALPPQDGSNAPRPSSLPYCFCKSVSGLQSGFGTADEWALPCLGQTRPGGLVVGQYGLRAFEGEARWLGRVPGAGRSF